MDELVYLLFVLNRGRGMILLHMLAHDQHTSISSSTTKAAQLADNSHVLCQMDIRLSSMCLTGFANMNEIIVNGWTSRSTI